MATKKQIAANRRNARKSTGPKTPEGKAASSMNALRHGLRAQRVILRDESQDEFDLIHAGLQDQYQPQNAAEQLLVDQAAIIQWKLARAEAFERQCDDEAKSAAERAAILGRMTQIQCRLERAFFKAYKELERIKTLRQKVAEPPAKWPATADADAEDDSPDRPVVRLNWITPEEYQQREEARREKMNRS